MHGSVTKTRSADGALTRREVETLLRPAIVRAGDVANFDREHESVIVGGGNRSSKMRLDPRELLKLPNARVADVAIPR